MTVYGSNDWPALAPLHLLADDLDDYQQFLATKMAIPKPVGFDVTIDKINAILYRFQRDIVRWALQLGRAAIFADVGLGKTGMQLEWAHQVALHTGKPVLILAPLAVADQTVREGEKFGIPVYHVQNSGEVLNRCIEDKYPIFITNYERVADFDISIFSGVVLDESSILKHYSKTFFDLCQRFKDTPYRLCCTATPSPNDIVEIGNHSTFLDIMDFHDVLARWFVGEGDVARQARLKGHAELDFYRWLTSWAVCISKPSDLGDEYDMPGYERIEAEYYEYQLESDQKTIERAWKAGKLLPDTPSATSFMKVKHESLDGRVEKTIEIVEAGWGLSLTGNGDKLAACGNQNTQNGAEKNINPIPKNEPDDVHKGGQPSQIGNTWPSTTKPTKRNSKNTLANVPKSVTPAEENVTKTTPNIEKSVFLPLNPETNPQSETPDSKQSLVLTAPHTINSSVSKTDAVQYATHHWQTEEDIASTSITTMSQESSGDSSAQPAIWDLENSGTTPSFSQEPSNTSPQRPNLNPYLIWCDTDEEQRALEIAFGDFAISIYGSLSSSEKESRVIAWIRQDRPILISKPSIVGAGLNFQFCNQMIFVGVSFSFERTYQATGRIVRYGQKRIPHIHMIYAESEGSVMQRLQEKQRAFVDMQQMMNAAMRQYGLFRSGSGTVTFSETENNIARGENWEMHLGDCVQVSATFAPNSIDFSVHSPPFASLYTYSDKQADMGNAATEEEFFQHYGYLIKELLRVTKPGRVAALHVKDLPLFINRDSVMGINPFSDNVTVAFRSARLESEVDLPESQKTKWVLQSRITVGKDPVIEMQKTNSHGLLYKNWRTKAQALRVGLPDYVLVFRKFSTQPESAPVKHDPEDLTYYGENPPAGLMAIPSKRSGQINASLPVWQNYANPIWDDVAIPAVWQDIDQTNVLNFQIARDAKDERHLAPLQLDLIARLIHWYTNPGELVFDPFGGVGSTVYEAVKAGRRGVASELKPAYWRLACKYIRQAELEKSQPTLFEMAEV